MPYEDDALNTKLNGRQFDGGSKKQLKKKSQRGGVDEVENAFVVYTRPYSRTRQTMDAIMKKLIVPTSKWIVKEMVELREQEYGPYQQWRPQLNSNSKSNSGDSEPKKVDKITEFTKIITSATTEATNIATAFSEAIAEANNKTVQCYGDRSVYMLESERDTFSRFFYKWPRGESVADVYDRVSTFLDKFMGDLQRNKELGGNKTVIVVTHQNVLRCILMSLLKLNFDFNKQVQQPGTPDIDNAGYFCLKRTVGADATITRLQDGYNFENISIDPSKETYCQFSKPDTPEIEPLITNINAQIIAFNDNTLSDYKSYAPSNDNIFVDNYENLLQKLHPPTQHAGGGKSNSHRRKVRTSTKH